MSGYPILMYHALSEEAQGEYYTLTEADFRNQMRTIAESDRVGVSLEAMIKNGDRDGRGVVLTFDDGHVSNIVIALPVLREFGFTATFFVTTGRVGTSNEWLSWDDSCALQAARMDIQAHGHTHRFLDSLTESEQREELETPLRLLDAHLGEGCRHLSFPGGRYSRASIALARQLGYAALCTSEPGLNAVEGRYRGRTLRRYVVHQGTSRAEFMKIVARDTSHAISKYREYALKKLVKRALGNTLYHRLWSGLAKRREA